MAVVATGSLSRYHLLITMAPPAVAHHLVLDDDDDESVVSETTVRDPFSVFLCRHYQTVGRDEQLSREHVIRIALENTKLSNSPLPSPQQTIRWNYKTMLST